MRETEKYKERDRRFAHSTIHYSQTCTHDHAFRKTLSGCPNSSSGATPCKRMGRASRAAHRRHSHQGPGSKEGYCGGRSGRDGRSERQRTHVPCVRDREPAEPVQSLQGGLLLRSGVPAQFVEGTQEDVCRCRGRRAAHGGEGGVELSTTSPCIVGGA